MKKFLMMLKHNLGLKILAFVFAVGLWLYVLNVEDPEITRSFTVTVSFENEDTLSDVAKSYEVLNSSDEIRVTVSAQRSIIEELSSSDFSVVADLSDLSSSQMDGTQELEIYVSMNRYSGKTTIVSSTQYVTISIEDELTKTFDVDYATTGSPADGYAVGSVRVLPSTVSVTGITSAVEKIETAVVVVDVSGLDDDMSAAAEVVFYDADGLVCDVTDLEVDNPTVNVYLDCDVVKTISVEAVESGTPASGYRVASITTSADEITVQGEADALDGYDTLRISGDALDVTDATGSITVTIDPADYLSYGISMYEETEIEITIEILEYETVSLTIPTEEIAIEGLEDGYTASFEASSVSVTLSCPASMAESITESSVTLTADLSGKLDGSFYVSLRSELPDLVYLVGNLYATIVISEE